MILTFHVPPLARGQGLCSWLYVLYEKASLIVMVEPPGRIPRGFREVFHQ